MPACRPFSGDKDSEHIPRSTTGDPVGVLGRGGKRVRIPEDKTRGMATKKATEPKTPWPVETMLKLRENPVSEQHYRLATMRLRPNSSMPPPATPIRASAFGSGVGVSDTFVISKGSVAPTEVFENATTVEALVAVKLNW